MSFYFDTGTCRQLFDVLNLFYDRSEKPAFCFNCVLPEPRSTVLETV